MRKLSSIVFIAVSILVVLLVVNHAESVNKMNDNPYKKKRLQQASIDLIGNEHYNNIVLPKTVEDRIASGSPTTVYFFSPTCIYCKEMTPMLMPIAKELEREVLQYNLLEFEKGWDMHNIVSTPTLVHYKYGIEVNRISGLQAEEEIVQFLEGISRGPSIALKTAHE